MCPKSPVPHWCVVARPSRAGRKPCCAAGVSVGTQLLAPAFFMVAAVRFSESLPVQRGRCEMHGRDGMREREGRGRSRGKLGMDCARCGREKRR
eukprot:8815901-Pyramimonas_sp.AAC.1